MSSQRRPSRRRPAPQEIALWLTQGWFVVALLSIFFLHGFTFDQAGLQFHPNYLLIVVTALIPAAAWSWHYYTHDRLKEAGKSLQELQALSPDAFEEWVAARFREIGYATKITGTHGTGGDHGVDIIADKPGEKAVIQCKNWKAWKVGEPQVRDLYGALHHNKADRAYLVTTGSISQPAQIWARGKPIELWDGQRVAQLSRKAVASKEFGWAAEASIVDGLSQNEASPATEALAPVTAEPVKPRCPKCGSVLAEKRNRRTGELFLACPRFPACRHSQPLAS